MKSSSADTLLTMTGFLTTVTRKAPNDGYRRKSISGRDSPARKFLEFRQTFRPARRSLRNAQPVLCETLAPMENPDSAVFPVWPALAEGQTLAEPMQRRRSRT